MLHNALTLFYTGNGCSGLSLPAVFTILGLTSGAILPAMCGAVCRWEIFFRTGSIIFGGGQVGALSLMDCACMLWGSGTHVAPEWLHGGLPVERVQTWPAQRLRCLRCCASGTAEGT